MPASRSAVVVTSTTSLVEQALTQAQDFMTVPQIAAAVNLPSASIMTALRWLVKAKAADSLESGGRLYFFITPETDTRTKKVTEHRKEDEPRVVRNRRPYTRKAK